MSSDITATPTLHARLRIAPIESVTLEVVMLGRPLVSLHPTWLAHVLVIHSWIRVTRSVTETSVSTPGKNRFKGWRSNGTREIQVQSAEKQENNPPMSLFSRVGGHFAQGPLSDEGNKHRVVPKHWF
jgi:hypothetical protein